MLELGLKTFLASKNSISAIVGSRIWWSAPDPQTANLPDLTFDALTNFNSTHDGEGEDLQFPVVTVECRTLEPTPCITLADLVRRSLRELSSGATVSTTVGDVVFEQCEILAQGDDQATYQVDGTERTVYSRFVTCRLGFRFSTASVE